MRIAVLCHGTVLQPTLEALYSQNLLVGLGVPENMPEVNISLEQTAKKAGIPFIRLPASGLADQLGPWLQQIKADVVCTMGFPEKIPASLLDLPSFGFFNLHGGALPRYRGPDPVFWQIKDRQPSGAITIHRLAPKLDTGGVAHLEAVPIGPDDTYGLHLQRLGAVLPRVLIEFIQRLVIHGHKLPLVEQSAAEAQYQARPTDKDLAVDWAKSAAEIKALVKACNPRYLGASLLLKGIPLRLLQVTKGEDHESNHEFSPGTILEATSANGIRVACGQGETLFLDIIYAEDGFYSGCQLVKLFGLKAGEQMTSILVEDPNY